MCSPKQKVSIGSQTGVDNQINTSLNINSTYSDADSSMRSYALIETDPNELDRIIDLLRQFFPKTKIIGYNNQSYSSDIIAPQQQQQISIESNCSSHSPISSNTNSQTFKGKVKDYLQRRYLEQIDEHQSRKETSTKSRNDNINSFDLPSSSILLKSRSLDSSAIQIENSSMIHSPNKRGLLQHYTTIDIDESSNDTGQITFNIDQSDDDKKFQSSYSEQQINNTRFPVPHHHSSEQKQEKKAPSFSSAISLPLTPYSASSDPGPFHSPWFNTPTYTSTFQFPQSEEQLAVNAQGSIAQLSTLTKMLCDESSVFTPITPRFKLKNHNSHTSKDSSSIPPCQICRQEFDSHQMYLTHYRTHLESSSEDNQPDSDIKCDRSSDLRNYSCKICSKRFSRTDMLNRHLRLHSGIRPYRCTLCNTHFSRSDHLSTHLRTHTGEKPYTCPQCSYTACRRDMITRHSKIHRKQRSERKNATSTFASSNDS